MVLFTCLLTVTPALAQIPADTNSDNKLTKEELVNAILPYMLGEGSYTLDDVGDAAWVYAYWDGKPKIITDSAAREVTIYRPIERTIGIEAGALRLLVYLNATDTVIGVEENEKTWGTKNPYNIAHPELRELPSIGPFHGGNPELIAAQTPDVVFWTYTTTGKADDLQNKIDAPVIALGYGDLGKNRATFYHSLRLMGNILDKDARAREVIQYINDTINDLDSRTANIAENKTLKVYVGGIGYYGAHGLLSTEPAYPPFLFVHANNTASELGIEHAFISAETLIDWDPDVIFIDEGGYNLVMNDLEEDKYQDLSAVKNGKLYAVLPYNFYTTNYGTLLANAYYIGKVLYPEKFEDVDVEQKADEIYEQFVGKAVYQDMNNIFGGFKKIDLGV